MNSSLQDSVSMPPPDRRAMRIMVIDDSKTIRRTAETLLSREGFDVITAQDGYEALGMVVRHRPDLVFVDIMMPRLDGYQTCALIKRHPDFRRIPVVLLSSKDGLFDRAKGRLVGSERYLTKPFTREELLEAVSAFTAEREQAATERAH
ncbi:MAG: response regulator [Pseudomonadota bacterium]|nr:response regulator [Candidatus Acidoferrales bacterium]